MKCKGEECIKYYSCKYLKDRFKTTQCNYNKEKVERLHKKELRDREKLLRKIK